MLGTLYGCGGGSDSPVTPPVTPVLTGKFVPNTVANVAYSTSSGLVGNTDASGSYAYRAGDTVKFSIGKIVLGQGTAAALITPINLVSGATDFDNANVVKILQVLQTLDNDLDPSNGINIASAVVARLAALISEKNIKDITDLAADVIAPAFASGAPALTTAAAAKLHFADTLGALEASNQFAKFPGISNFVIGGANRNCSSFNGEGKSSNCAADWSTIIAQDPAFTGLTKANISFDATYALPEMRFSITQPNIDKLAAAPTSLFDASRKAALITAVNARLATPAAKTALSFSDFDGSKPLFANGSTLWNSTLSLPDFELMLLTLCAAPSPGNGADCSLSNASIAAVESATFSTAVNARLAVVLRNLQAAYGNVIKYRRDSAGNTVTPNLRTEFQARQLAADGSPVQAGLTLNLSRTEVAILRSAFADSVAAQLNRKIEARTVKFLADKASFDIYTSFVAAAQAANGGKKPMIGVVTASAENPFGDRDINVMALQSAGADVIYLPLEGGLRKAIDAGDCANTQFYYDGYANTSASGDYFNMAQIYPDLATLQTSYCAANGASLTAAIGGLSGIFFSGGDQSRHLESLVTKDASKAYSVASPQLVALKARFDAGQLVVGGTSAGNHIQGGGQWKGKPVSMIGGGDSYATLKGGFVPGTGPLPASDNSPNSYANGGLGFFKFGVLDSHFSRRTREGRLLRHTKETGSDYGFGVDENTSLVVGRPDAAGKTSFAVLGMGGVFIVDVRGAVATGGVSGNYSIDGAKAHYLTPGDTAEIDAAGNLTVTLSPTKPLLAAVSGQPTVKQTQVQDYGSANFLALAKATGVAGAAIGYGTTENSTDGNQSSPLYSATLSRAAATSFRGISNGRVSYTNINLKFAPCASTCVTP